MRLALAFIAVLVLLTGCGGSDTPPSADPVEQVPDIPGLREAVREAQTPDPASFPDPKGKTLQQVADLVTAGPQAAMASSNFTVGDSRFAFGVIGQDGKPIYGPTAIYVAPTPNEPAQGPFVAPADVLLTAPRYRSEQAARETDPFAAIYAAPVKFDEAGQWAVLVMTRSGGRLVGAPTQIQVKTKAQDKVPDVGETAPQVATDTLDTVKGDKALLDTRKPPSDMHTDFATVVGKKPVALLFSTPQLCESRVCGPVTDVALQLQAKYGKQMTFIHQEVYTGNQVNRGLREPLKAFNLQTEPWLFVVDRRGKVTARLEGSFGLDAFETAIKTGL
ncbi:hypothetical protein [Solirubrobacter soli]|uniref:hypothetical protein n=1 Tax=Solirubrobacter soli TaxID=363832 RepID=UPI000414C528|nr:hypothetical protein [Solirubrobacter soli]